MTLLAGGLAALLALSTPAALAQTGTDLSEQEEATLILQLREKQASLSGELAALRKKVAALPAGTSDPALAGRVTTLETQVAAINRTLEGVATDAELKVVADALAGKASVADLQALTRRVSSLETRVTALENAPRPRDTTVIKVGSSSFHPTAYLAGGGVFGPAIEDGTQGIAGRVTLGVRPTWDVTPDGAVALFLEGNYGSGGPGTRGVVSYVHYTGKAGGFGGGLGVGYNCDDLVWGEGCLTEHVGGLARGSWEMGGKLGGFLVLADLEVNYLTLDGMPEARTVIQVGGYLGNSRPAMITVR